MARIYTQILLLLFAGLASGLAASHEASSSHLYWQHSQAESLRLDIALDDLVTHFALATDALAWRDLVDAEQTLAAKIEARLDIRQAGQSCEPRAHLAGLSDYSDGRYSVWQLVWRCPDPAAAMTVDYQLFFARDALHRVLVELGHPERTQLTLLSPTDRELVLNRDASRADVGARFLLQGMLHMWLGLDHVLFLLCLLMLAFIEPAAERRLSRLVWIVTSFTAAHSLTLILSSLGVITLSSALVETLIALSIVFSATKVIFPRLRINTLLLSFGFGLLHGMGFAGMLAELLTGTDGKLLALFSFNIGVELAQLSLVLLAYPLLRALAKWPTAQTRLFTGMSAAIIVIGVFWAVERSGLL